jgi:L-erythro-3,5-diaminohexanoate dehydrogenase
MRGNRYGTHRVIEPIGYLPQPAYKLNNDFSILYSNEILIDVIFLNIDSSSFKQIEKEAGGNKKKIEEIILKIVNERGKMQNPVTGSGGMLVGVVEKIGEDLKGKIELEEGDKIASLVSLSLTPLKINKIKEIYMEKDQVEIDGKAVLFESGIFVKLPNDINLRTSLSILDVAGAPIQVARLVKPNDYVFIIGAGGKSGLLCCYESKKRVGPKGKVIAMAHSEKSYERIKKLGFYDHLFIGDAQNPISVLEEVEKFTDKRLADVVINCVNVPDTEITSILTCKERGIVYFFSMATSFSKAALGAEGVGKDIDMIIGNGYAKNHAEYTLNLLRESKKLRDIFEEYYGGER